MNEFSNRDRFFMSRALELAEQAAAQQEVPVGAVLVSDNKIIGEGSNSPISAHDPSAHAEINALRQAGQALQNYRLPETTLYLTLEPCPMCAGAIVHARVSKVFCAAREPRAGAGGSLLNLLQHPKLNHHCELSFGLFEEKSSQLLKAFFKERRTN